MGVINGRCDRVPLLACASSRLAHRCRMACSARSFVGVAGFLQAMERLSLGSMQVASILLGGLLVYDIFWVYG